MEIPYHQIHRYLNTEHMKVCWLSSDDAFLLYQTQKQITGEKNQNTAQKNFTINNDSDWQSLQSQLVGLDLFYEKQQMFIHISKVNAKIAEKIQTLIANINAKTQIFIISEKITSAQKNTKWYKELIKHISHVAIWPLNHKSYDNWLKQQLKFYSLNITVDGLQSITAISELDARISINILEKLAINYDSKMKISASHVLETSSETCSSSIFAIANDTLNGNVNKAIDNINNINKSSANIMILWSVLHKAISSIYAASMENPYNIKKFARTFIEQETFNAVLSRHKTKDLRAILVQLWMLENTIKGLSPENDAWIEMEKTIIMLGKTNAN